MDLPELVAHRGYTRHFPENTLAAVRAAITAGARFVEVDIQLTRDEVPVLFHDRTLERLCGQRGTIYDYTASQLSRFHASDYSRFGYRFAQEPIASLASLVELLSAHADVTAFIEIKRVSLERFGDTLVITRMLSAIEPIVTRCVFISYSLSALQAVRRHSPIPVGFVVDHWKDRLQEGMDALAPEYLFCDAEGLPRFGKLAFPEAKLAVFEVDDAARARELHARGVDLIETFAIGELAQALGLPGRP